MVKLFTLKWGKDNERATSYFRYTSEVSENFALHMRLRCIGIGK